MKKIVCFLLAACMVFSLAACGRKSTENVESVVSEVQKPVQKKYNLSAMPPNEGIQIVDNSGNVWFTTSDIDVVSSCYHKEIGRYLEIVLKDGVKSKLEEASQKKITEFSIIIGEETFAGFKIHIEEDETKTLIYADKKDPIMKCYNALT